MRGGVEHDLLDGVIWWQADDYWLYALYAAVALIRAGAERLGVPVAQLSGQLAEQHRVALT